ncbi:LLM class oxidoreductase [Corynebacterium sp. YIM 101645]|uniref:LLM class oxidoreductase n=1 Tax=Corynebacterium lemuris TaxID=1859292 RepID=A0ABT2FZ77_9CORY|nr:LLM class oxidoreductase [Corynebacterium lemuris]MCS5480557.1 LLM class oxidoreductase [Corynebacterium lemuris]
MVPPFSLSDAPVTALPGFRRTFPRGRLTLGLFLPVDAGRAEEPDVDIIRQVELVRRAEAAGFAAVWLRDIPLRDPDFGDVGQVWDPVSYLGYLAASTSKIALGTGAVVAPLRHPLHLAKQAASIDHLSAGRFLFGVATGDRSSEFPAFGVAEGERDAVFREHLQVMQQAWTTEKRGIRWSGGRMWGGDVVPKPLAVRPPLLTVGSCLQSMAWHREHADAHVTYQRPLPVQKKYLDTWREEGNDRPFAMSMSLDLHPDPGAAAGPIKFGWRVGVRHLRRILHELEDMGVDHVILGLKRGSRPAGEMLDELIEQVVPAFHA